MMEDFTDETIQRIRIGAIEYAYLKKGSGPTVLLIHGFPDDAISWEFTMNELAKAGFSTIAPFLKGYYPSDLSPDGDYSVKPVAEDLLSMMSMLGQDQFYLVGHDWGASIAYTIATLAPERVLKLTALSIPHPRAIKPSLKLAYQARHFIVFQMHSFSLWYTKRNNFAYIDYIFKWWSPKWTAPQDFRNRIKASFSQPGYLDAALGYYRSFGKNARNKELKKLSITKTSVPCQVIVGDSDGAIDLAIIQKMDYCFTNSYQLDIIADAGHFPHSEKPIIFSQLLINYLK